MVEKTPVLIRFDAAQLAEIDLVRGDVPRAAFIRKCVSHALHPPYVAINLTQAALIVEAAGTEAEALIDKVEASMAQGAQGVRRKAKPFKSRLKGEWKVP